MARPIRRSGNLPTAATSFIGRRHELAELRKKLTAARLVSLVGPGGVGKTTLLDEWLATSEGGQGRAAWVALDQSDNEPALFWADFIAALQTLDAQIGKNTLGVR
jgi:ATP/maltotriose-dependent transcriptional regulator MalT